MGLQFLKISNLFLQMNSSLDDLVKSVSRTTDLYDRKGDVSDQNSHMTLDRPTSPVFLSQLTQEEYNKTEDKFTQELTSYTKRLFFEVNRFLELYSVI